MRDIETIYSLNNILKTRSEIPEVTQTLTISSMSNNYIIVSSLPYKTLNEISTNLTKTEILYGVLDFGNGNIRIINDVDIAFKTICFRIPLQLTNYTTVTFSTLPLAEINIYIGSGVERNLQALIYVSDVEESNYAIGDSYGSKKQNSIGYIIVKYMHKIETGKDYAYGEYYIRKAVGQIKQAIDSEILDHCMGIDFNKVKFDSSIEKNGTNINITYQAIVSFTIEGII
jgi:hypothetical protein